MKTHHKHLLSAALLTALLAGCGGGDDFVAPPPPPPPPAPAAVDGGGPPPASASVDTAGLTSYLTQVTASHSDVADPLDLSSFMLPATDDSAAPITTANDASS